MRKKLNNIDIKKEILSDDWINHPHDKFFKIVFSEIENTIDTDYKKIAEEIKKASKKGGDLAMTAAQRILGLIEEGRTEERKELIVKMFNENMKIGDISRFTGLSKNEIETILKVN